MKNLWFLLYFLTILAACSRGKHYSVCGVVEGAEEGDTILLFYSKDGQEREIVARTTIEDGRFEFEGETEGCRLFYLGWEKGAAPLYAMFFLESGNAEAVISRNGSTVRGTPANELNSDSEDTIRYYAAELYRIETMFQRSDSTDSDMIIELGLKGYELQNRLREFIQRNVEENIGGLYGLYMLVLYNEFFETEEFAGMLERVPAGSIERDNNPLYDIALEIKEYREKTGL